MKRCAKISHIDSEKIVLTYIRNSACAHCKSKKACLDAEQKVETLELNKDQIQFDEKNYSLGEEVNLYIKSKISPLYIIMLLYGIPVLFIAGFVFFAYYMNYSELVQALFFFLSLPVSFAIVKLMEIKILKNRGIQYGIEKNETNN